MIAVEVLDRSVRCGPRATTLIDVRYWHLADMPTTLSDVRF
jgi:hypothetical protein